MIDRSRIITAGAYIMVNGHFPFVLGTAMKRKQLVVIRVGGHREGVETPWECTVREAWEEAWLRIQPMDVPVTYATRGAWDELEEITWPNDGQPRPVLIRERPATGEFSFMYFARASGLPMPSAEVKGLLLLKPSDISRICNNQITLQEYLDGGGRAMLRRSYNHQFVLEPGFQLRQLARILQLHPQLLATAQAGA